MIIPDANLLIYAHDELAPAHPKARDWWQSVLSGSEAVGLPWVVVLAFIRLMTHPQICQNPLSADEVRNVVQQWTACPHVHVINLSEDGLSVFFDLLDEAGMGGNLSTDALIAAHARKHSATVYSNDRDFDRFKGIKCVNPLR